MDKRDQWRLDKRDQWRMDKRDQWRGEKISLDPRRRRFATRALGALTFVILTVVLVIVAGPLLLPLAAVAVPFFGLLFLWTLSRLLRPRPLLTIDAQGIRDSSSLLAAGVLRWDEIARVSVTGLGRHRFLCILPADPAAFLQRQAPLTRRLMRANSALLGAPVTIAQAALPLSLDEVIAAMHAFGLPLPDDEASPD